VYGLTHFITKADIFATLEQCVSEQEEQACLEKYQLLPGDLAQDLSVKAVANSLKPIATLTKAQLIERVRQLEAELDALRRENTPQS